MQTTGRGRRNCEDRKRAMKEGKLSERRRASLNALLVSFVIGSLSLLLFFSYSSSPFVFADELLAQEAEMEKRVTCGSAIKLTHTATKAKLHSHGIGYGSGSGQQSVTGFPESNDPGGYWQVFGTREEPCERGEDIADGRVIRLLHVQTRKWLHSHAAHRSPLTNNQEVSAHGDDENSDAGDEWKFEVADGNKGDKAGPVWKKDQKVRLQHRQTKAFLSCSNTKFQRPISGQNEVCGTSRSDANSVWKADQGVYFPKVEL
jgi:dolichyl-phosphate-mannose--protein O-mannosyl transferase